MRRTLSLLTLAALLLAPLGVQAQNSPNPIVTTTNMQTGAAATGNGTALATYQGGTAVFQVTGTFVGTVTFEGTLDGTNYVTLPSCTGNGAVTSLTGMSYCNVTGLSQVRARVSAWTSGSITVIGQSTSSSSLAPGMTPGSGQLPAFYSQTLNPTAMAALLGDIVAKSADQTFTVPGLGVGQTVFINGPAPTALCPPAHVRISAANTLSVTFLQLTSAVCTPATGTYQIVSASPSNMANVGTVYVQTFNPAAIAATGSVAIVANSAEQPFTVTGLQTSNRVFVNGPAPTALCPPTHWRVSAGNTLTGSFVQLTSAVCTPATGTYQVVAL